MEPELCQLLPDFGGGLLGELDPNPLANHGRALRGGGDGGELFDHLGGGEQAVLLAGFGVDGQAVFRLGGGGWGLGSGVLGV